MFFKLEKNIKIDIFKFIINAILCKIFIFSKFAFFLNFKFLIFYLDILIILKCDLHLCLGNFFLAIMLSKNYYKTHKFLSVEI